MTIAESLDAALTVLDVLKEIGIGPGDVVPNERLKAAFHARGRDPEEIKGGLKCAHGQHWLEYDSAAEVFVLTQGGYEEV